MADICDRKPDRKQKLTGGITVHYYRAVPRSEAVDLVLCRRKDPGYWDEDFAPESDSTMCTVMIMYRKSETEAE